MPKKLCVSEVFSPVFNRMIELADETGIAISTLLDKYCTSRSAMSAWKNGNIGVDIIPKIANEFNVTSDYLLTGNKTDIKLSGDLSDSERELLNSFSKLSSDDKIRVIERAETLIDMSKPSKSELRPEEPDEQEDNICEIPLYDTAASAGTGIEIDYTTSEPLSVSADDSEEGDFAVRVSGDSMEPRFYSGDIVLVEAAPTVEQGEIGIFIFNNQSYIKELGEGCLISLNQKYKPIAVTDEDTVYCQGRVLKVLSVAKG